MLRWLIGKRLDAVEKELGVEVDYLRHILEVSPRAFFRFVKVMPLAEYRGSLPAAPLHVARLVATRHEDCGACVQIEVNLARKDGVAPAVVRAVLDRDLAALDEELREAYLFAEAVVTQSDAQDALREAVRRRHGEVGLVELSLALAVCRIFPTVKRALGHARSCSAVPVQV